MATECNLTGDTPITATVTTKMPLAEAVGVVDFDIASMIATVTDKAGTNFTLNLITGNSKSTEAGWVIAATFVAGASTTGSWGANTTFLGKYLRWEIVLNGATSVTFVVSGLLRHN